MLMNVSKNQLTNVIRWQTAQTLMAHTIARVLLVLQEVEKIVQGIIVHRFYLMKEIMAKENDEVSLWHCPLV